MPCPVSEFGKLVTICLPTFNEAETLPKLTKTIHSFLPEARLLVIDDNSPDGTGEIAEGLSRDNSLINVIHRPKKEGLGPAYMEAFRHCMEQADCELIVQMDSDFSHPPARLPAMIKASENANLVIGSRYVSEGGVENWELHRKLLSKFGSFYAKFFLGVNVNDLTGGFKVWKKELLQKIIQQPISSGGYCFQIETTYIASKLGAKIKEVPILFTDRNLGASKMTLSIALEAFWKTPWLRWHYRDLHTES